MVPSETLWVWVCKIQSCKEAPLLSHQIIWNWPFVHRSRAAILRVVIKVTLANNKAELQSQRCVMRKTFEKIAWFGMVIRSWTASNLISSYQERKLNHQPCGPESCINGKNGCQIQKYLVRTFYQHSFSLKSGSMNDIGIKDPDHPCLACFRRLISMLSYGLVYKSANYQLKRKTLFTQGLKADDCPFIPFESWIYKLTLCTLTCICLLASTCSDDSLPDMLGTTSSVTTPAFTESDRVNHDCKSVAIVDVCSRAND